MTSERFEINISKVDACSAAINTLDSFVLDKLETLRVCVFLHMDEVQVSLVFHFIKIPHIPSGLWAGMRVSHELSPH